MNQASSYMALIPPRSRGKSWSHMGARGPWTASCSIVKHNLNNASVIWSEHLVVRGFTFIIKIKRAFAPKYEWPSALIPVNYTNCPKILTCFIIIMYKLMLGEHEFKVRVSSSSVLWEFKSIEFKINPKSLLPRIQQQYM